MYFMSLNFTPRLLLIYMVLSTSDFCYAYMILFLFLQIEDQKSAPKWPGLLSVMQSFFAFNTRRDISLTNAREKVRLLKNRKCKLTEQKKLLAGVLKVGCICIFHRAF